MPLYIPVPSSKGRDFLRARCGHCINCKFYRSGQWSMRLEMESHDWDKMCFVTLTYDDEHLPYNYVDPHIFFSDEEVEEKGLEIIYYPTLSSRDLQLFVKRLRKHAACNLRYFGVGEYGTKRHRPHLHLLVYGLDTGDEHLIKDCWSNGFIKVTPFHPGTTSAYVAQYVQKKLYGDDKDMFKLPEFMHCSQHLGERWFFEQVDKGYIDLKAGYINWHGFKYGIPRTFRKKLIDKGLVKANSMDFVAMQQRMEYRELAADLASKGANVDDFFRQRRINALHKEKKKLSSRENRSLNNYEIS